MALDSRPLVDLVSAILEGVPGVEAHPSQFAELPAWWVDGREFAHAGADGWVDLRLTRALICGQRDWLRADARFRLRRSASDWIEIDVSGGIDDEVAGLFGAASSGGQPAGRPGPGVGPGAGGCAGAEAPPVTCPPESQAYGSQVT